MKPIHLLVFVLFFYISCKNDHSSSAENNTSPSVEIQILNDTLSNLSNQSMTFSNGTSEILPFANDSTTTVMVMVRHAEKDTAGKDPILTEEGRARAAKLAAILKNFPLNGVYSTQFVRTLKTAQPSAIEHQQPIMIYDPKDQDFITRLAKKHLGEHLLIVGHSNTIPVMVNQLAGKEQFKQIDDQDYGNLFIVVIGDSDKSVKVIRAVF